MLKKSLILVAVLAIAMPAFAVDSSAQKFHKDWSSTTTTVYHYQDIATMKVLMDVGYWIQIKNTNDIKVSQQSINGSDPFKTYSGCKSGVTVVTNFNATLKASAAAYAPTWPNLSDGGSWTATIDGLATKDFTPGSTNFTVCVTGTNVKIEKLTMEQKDNVQVAVVTISVIPTEHAGQAG